MRSFSEEEADKFVMKHHKHGGKEEGTRGEEKTEGESGLMKNKADGEQRKSAASWAKIGPSQREWEECTVNAQRVNYSPISNISFDSLSAAEN